MYREIKLHKMAMKEITPQMKGMEYFCMSHTPFGMESIPVWGLFFAFPGIKKKFRIKEPLILGIWKQNGNKEPLGCQVFEKPS